MMRVRLVTPLSWQDPGTLEALRSLETPDLVLDAVIIENGPRSIEAQYDEELATLGTLQRIVEAEAEGIDAVAIDCMGDPALHAARELVCIPVVGPGETSVHTAAMLGDKFSFVSVMESIRPVFSRMLRGYGLHDRLASFRCVDIPVTELNDDRKQLEVRLCTEALRAARDDHASVIVLGCTGFVGLARRIEEYLRTEIGSYVPVIDPIPLAVATAVSWVTCRLTHSRRFSRKPPPGLYCTQQPQRR